MMSRVSGTQRARVRKKASAAKAPAQKELAIVPMRTIGVRFQKGTGSKVYSYYVPDGDAPLVGDLVLTRMHEDLHLTEFGVAEVVEVHETPSSAATKPYVYLIDMKKVRERMAQEVVFAEAAARRKRAEKELNNLLMHEGRMDAYRSLAKKNEEAARLLKILESGVEFDEGEEQ